MNTREIDNILRADERVSKVYKGTFPWDKCPTLAYNGVYVINTDCSHRPGQHWVAYYVKNGRVEFFDSYANPPSYYRVLPHANVFNKKRLQGLQSTTCGQYCVYYILHRCRGHGMEDIARRFGTDLHDNDHAVAEYMSKCFGLEIPVHYK